MTWALIDFHGKIRLRGASIQGRGRGGAERKGAECKGVSARA